MKRKAATLGGWGLIGLSATVAIHYPVAGLITFGALAVLGLSCMSYEERLQRREWSRIAENFRRLTPEYFVPPRPTSGQKPN